MAYAIADYEAQTAALLKDAAYTTWTTDELDYALAHALQQYSNHFPYRQHKTAVLTTSARFYDLTAAPFSLTNILAIEQVAYPYVSDEASGPLIPFDLRGLTLVVLTTSLPDIGDSMYIDYCTIHTINGLEAATATTIPDPHAHLLTLGAAGYAAYAKANSIAREFNWPPAAARELKDWGTTLLKAFHAGLADVAPASCWASWASLPNPEGL